MEVYPQPDIQSLFRRITDAVQPFISQSEFESYQQAVGYLFSNTKPTAVSERIASQSIDQISKLFPGSKNWATEWYIRSCSQPQTYHAHTDACVCEGYCR